MTNLQDNEPLSLLSLNTNGLGEQNKRLKIINWLNKQQQAENKIIFLQETHCTDKMENLWKADWNNDKIYFSNGSSGSKGVAIILPKTMNYKLVKITRSEDG